MDTAHNSHIDEKIYSANRLRDSIILMFLGALIIGLLWVFSEYIFVGYWELYFLDAATNQFMPLIIHWPGIVSHNYWLTNYLLIGIAVFACGVAQLFYAGRLAKSGDKHPGIMALSVLPIILGILFIVLLIWYLVRIEPDWSSYSSMVIASNGGESVIFHDPGWTRLLLSWKITNYLIALAVLGLGIVQIQRSRTGCKRE